MLPPVVSDEALTRASVPRNQIASAPVTGLDGMIAAVICASPFYLTKHRVSQLTEA
jgi:hypothetical protein